MSEAPAEVAAGTDAAGTDADSATQSAEDVEADGLLGDMADQDPEELQRQLTHWKAQARKWEGRASTNKDAAAKLKEIEDRDKTELQRATEAATAAAQERDEAIASHNRVMAAAAHDLPTDLVDFLGSGTSDEIAERAEVLATAIQTRAEQIADDIVTRNGYPSVSGMGGMRPIESLRPGSAPASGGTPSTKDDFLRQMLTTPQD